MYSILQAFPAYHEAIYVHCVTIWSYIVQCDCNSYNSKQIILKIRSTNTNLNWERNNSKKKLLFFDFYFVLIISFIFVALIVFFLFLAVGLASSFHSLKYSALTGSREEKNVLKAAYYRANISADWDDLQIEWCNCRAHLLQFNCSVICFAHFLSVSHSLSIYLSISLVRSSYRFLFVSRSPCFSLPRSLN